MKKHLHIAIVFLLFLIASCATDKFETQESNKANAAAVWAYDGNNNVLKRVIQELKSGSQRESLERKLSKNEVLWDNARFTLIDGKKWILVPFLSEDKDNVIGVLSLVKNSKNTTTYDMTVRSRLMVKNNKLPFWDNGIWLGYFMALDKNILGIKNGNPGFKSIKNPKALAQREVCGTYEVETIHYSYYYILNTSTGEASNFGIKDVYSTFEYYPICYEVADNPPPTDSGSGGDNGGDSGDGGSSITALIANNINYTNLDPCPKEIMGQLKNTTNSNISNILKKLDANSLYTVTMKMEAANTYAETQKISRYNYIIRVDRDQYTNGTKLFKAISLIHELIHAYFLSIVDDYNYTPTTTPLNSSTFPELFEAYVKKTYPNPSDAQHKEMADKYVDAMATALHEYDANYTIPSQVYKDLAWGSLMDAPIFNKTYPPGSVESIRIKNRYAAESIGRAVEEGTPNMQAPIGKPCN